MALADIKEKIIKDAEAEAKASLAKNKQELARRSHVIEVEIAQEIEKIKQGLQERVRRTVEQGRVLAKMEAGKQMLQAKREYLSRLSAEIEAEILDDEALLQKFLVKILARIRSGLEQGKKLKIEVSAKNEKVLKKALEELKLDGDTASKKEWPAGRMELVFTKSLLDCSLGQYLKEELKLREKEIAGMLFS